MEPDNQSTEIYALDGVIVFLAISSVLYFSFMPFLYVVNFIGIHKVTGYIVVLSLSLALAAIRSATAGINKNILQIFLWYLLFPGYAVLGYEFAGQSTHAQFTIMTITIISACAVLLSFFCSQHKKQVCISLFIFSGLYLLFTTEALISGRIGIDIYSTIIFPGDKMVEMGAYQNINVYLGMFSVLTLATIDKEAAIIKKWMAIMAILSTIYLMAIIGGRASILGLLLVIIVYAANASQDIPWTARNLIKLLLASMLILALIEYLSNADLGYAKNYIGVRRFLALRESGDTSERIFLFSKALELFLRDGKTFLFGAGINGFPAYIHQYAPGSYPHNVILELLAEYGIIGFILFMIPLALIIIARRKELGCIYGNNKYEKTVFLLAVYFWVISSFTGDMSTSWVLIFFTFLIYPSSEVKLSGYNKM